MKAKHLVTIAMAIVAAINVLAQQELLPADLAGSVGALLAALAGYFTNRKA